MRAVPRNAVVSKGSATRSLRVIHRRDAHAAFKLTATLKALLFYCFPTQECFGWPAPLCVSMFCVPDFCRRRFLTPKSDSRVSCQITEEYLGFDLAAFNDTLHVIE